MTERISFTEYCRLMNRVAGWLVKNKKKFKKRDVYSFMKKAAKRATIEKAALANYNANNWASTAVIAVYVECAIMDNASLEFLPAFVTAKNGRKYYKKTYVDMAKSVRSYKVTTKNAPAVIEIDKNTPTSDNTPSLLQKAYNLFGKFETCTEWLSKIQGRGYSYYYNNQYSNETTLNRIKNQQGVNCTDSVELTYNLLVALGYTVQIIHVYCRGGDGHVRIRVKHPKWTKNQWEYYDPAAVLNGNSIYSNWCMDGDVIAYDPSWIMATIKD